MGSTHRSPYSMSNSKSTAATLTRLKEGVFNLTLVVYTHGKQIDHLLQENVSYPSAQRRLSFSTKPPGQEPSRGRSCSSVPEDSGESIMAEVLSITEKLDVLTAVVADQGKKLDEIMRISRESAKGDDSKKCELRRLFSIVVVSGTLSALGKAYNNTRRDNPCKVSTVEEIVNLTGR